MKGLQKEVIHESSKPLFSFSGWYVNFDILVGGYEGWLQNIKNTSKFEVVVLHFYRAFVRTKNTSSSTASHIASVVLFFISPKFPVVPHLCRVNIVVSMFPRSFLVVHPFTDPNMEMACFLPFCSRNCWNPRRHGADGVWNVPSSRRWVELGQVHFIDRIADLSKTIATVVLFGEVKCESAHRMGELCQ